MVAFVSALVVFSAIDAGDGLSIIGTWIGVGFLDGVLSMFMFALVLMLMLLLKVVLLFVMDDVVVVIVIVFVKFN